MILNVMDAPTLLNLDAVSAKTGLNRSAIYYLERSGQFPRGVEISPGRRVVWVESEINAWITEKIQARQQAIDDFIAATYTKKVAR